MTVRKFITPDEMEIITEGILAEYGYPLSLNGNPEAIPINELIEFHYNLDIAWEPIDRFSEDGLVMAAIIPSKRKVIMNESCKGLFEEKIGTMNFTMAHELGHWVLHVDDKFNQQIPFDFKQEDTYYCRNFSKKPPEEYQADMFAGCLLLPKPILVPLIDLLKNTHEVIRFPHLYSICKIFEVSISALTVRLQSLRLFHIDEKGNIHKSIDDYTGQMTFNL